MSEGTSFRRGLYFEEFEIGQKVISPGRTVSAADITNFAGVAGDFNSIHTDAVYAAETPFGQRVAHGLLILSIASGLSVRTGLMEGTVLAFREIENWKFSKPVFIGDTVHVEMKVVETKALPRLGGGSVNLQLNVINQHGDTVMKGNWIALMMNKPA